MSEITANNVAFILRSVLRLLEISYIDNYFNL